MPRKPREISRLLASPLYIATNWHCKVTNNSTAGPAPQVYCKSKVLNVASLIIFDFGAQHAQLWPRTPCLGSAYGVYAWKEIEHGAETAVDLGVHTMLGLLCLQHVCCFLASGALPLEWRPTRRVNAWRVVLCNVDG